MTYPESQEQMTVIEWCRWNGYPYNLVYAVENERKATPQQAARRKAMGVRSGVSDLFLPVSRHGYHGMYVEMKAKEGKVSEAQRQFIDEVTREGYLAHVCYGADEAIEALIKYCAR